MLLFVRARPKASKSAIVGVRVEAAAHADAGGSTSGSPARGRAELEVQVNAPPEDGAANTELVRFLARALGRPKTSLVVERGHTSRHKTLRLVGATLAEIESALGVLTEGDASRVE